MRYWFIRVYMTHIATKQGCLREFVYRAKEQPNWVETQEGYVTNKVVVKELVL